jgi:aspartyl-tRNA(Asn)/glutamyl-tRNA(Gln) amidotransferase subunit B
LQLQNENHKENHKENEPLGTRTKFKNIGSIRAVAQAVTYEIGRQKEVKGKGGAIVNETRSWDAATRTTIPMRDKEVVQDYRFMPEPNLPPLHLNLSGDVKNENFINVPAIKRCLPMMPQEKKEKLASDHNLT